MYVVVKSAVYLHEVYGPFDVTEVEARALAQRYASEDEDRDDHHEYGVSLLTTEGLKETSASYRYGGPGYPDDDPEHWHQPSGIDHAAALREDRSR